MEIGIRMARPGRASDAISLIKWTGSKRLQAARIVAHFPAEIATYHEPFLGGGSVLGRLLDSAIRVGRYECSDSYAPLIALWNLVKDDPDRLIDGYSRLRRDATAGGEGHYHEVRRSFNRDRCPVEFFFLLRTCRVGHVRINAKGDFTSAFDRSRAGTDPDLLRPVVQAWHRKLVAADVRFAVRDYREVVSGPGDLLYLDPPYRTSTLYYGRMDYGEMFSWLGPQSGQLPPLAQRACRGRGSHPRRARRPVRRARPGRGGGQPVPSPDRAGRDSGDRQPVRPAWGGLGAAGGPAPDRRE